MTRTEKGTPETGIVMVVMTTSTARDLEIMAAPGSMKAGTTIEIRGRLENDLAKDPDPETETDAIVTETGMTRNLRGKSRMSLMTRTTINPRLRPNTKSQSGPNEKRMVTLLTNQANHETLPSMKMFCT